MQVIDPKNDPSKVFALGYGGSGTGKTHIAGTLGELGYTLIIDADKGFKTLTNPNVPGITQKMRDNLVIVSFDMFKDLDSALRLFEANDPDKWSSALSTAGNKVEITKPFAWGVWDTWSAVQWLMKQQLRKEKGISTISNNLRIGFRKNLEIQHWGMLSDLNTLALEEFREVTYSGTMNQLFLMQEKVDKNDELGVVERGPAIHGKMVKEVPTYFDIVFHTYTSPGGAGYHATTKPVGGWPAKSRCGAGQDYADPTAKKLFAV